jgi:hypothetical protein
MKMVKWETVVGFSKNEFAPPEPVAGDWDMNINLIDTLVELRNRGNQKYGGEFRILIHNNGGFSVDGHSKTSLHYKGRAVDFHMEHYSDTHKCWALVPWIDQVVLLRTLLDGQEQDFGVGLHPNWNNQGFHLDYRNGAGKNGAVWWDKGGKYVTMSWTHFGECVIDVLRFEFHKDQLGVSL